MRSLFLLIGICCTVFAYSQNNLQDIFKSSRQFDEIVRQGEAYFRGKHPDIPFYELTIGEHRDGEFVKFMRWQKFWSERLNPDGSLGDPSAYWRKQKREDNASKMMTSPYANVQWTNISYEDYIISQIGLGRTTSMAFHPTITSTFYVGAAIGGIWKTSDGGQSYTPLGDELPFMAVSSIVVDQQTPSTIYIAVSDHVWYGPSSIGVYKSTDGGSTWNETALTFNFADNIRIYWMEADPNDPNTMMVATANGTYRTTDGFATVDRVSTTASFSVKYMPGSSSTVYIGGTNGQFFKSTNGGTSFSQITDFGSSNVLAVVTALDPQKVFVRNGSSLHKSFDAGNSFTQTHSFSTSNEVFAFAPADDDVIISGNFDCYRSNNAGSSFTPITHWLGDNGLPNIHVDQRNVFTNPLESDVVYFCNDGGIYRYSVSTNTFTNLSNGLLITQFYDIAVSQTNANIIGGGSQDNGNVFRDASGNWSQYANTGDGMNQEIDPTNASIRYWEYQYGSMHRWQNGSNSNISPSGQGGNGAWETPFKLDPSNADRLVCAYDIVYESFNNGSSWNAISGQLSNGSDMNELAIAPSNGERIYVTQGSSLYVKNTNNDNWTAKSLPNGSVSDIEVDFLDMDIVYVCVPGYGDGQKVYKSTDAGSSWTNISGTLPNVSVGALEMYEGTTGGVFIGTDAGVYYRDDDLSDWLEYGDLPHTRVEDIEIQYSAELIRIGTHGRGVLEAPIEVEACTASSDDSDGDGFCDLIDTCPGFDNNLIGEACDDGDEFSVGETYAATCECEGGAANLDYCDAAGSPGTGSDYITRVQLEAIDNSSGKTAYSDFRSISTRLEHGGSYPISVTLQAAFEPDRVHVWIDYDRSGTFEASEATTMGIPENTISTGTVNIPLDAVMGATTMRVRVVYSTTFDDPCGNAFGEVEDYTVFLDCPAAGISCDDGDSNTENDVTDGLCGCAGTPISVCTYEVIDSNDFESGLGIWNDGGADCNLISAEIAANSGTYSVWIRDNTNSSVLTTDDLDLSAYEELSVSFSFLPRSMESGEDFWLQISTNGGASYTTVEEWTRGNEFGNLQRIDDEVTINGSFTQNTRLRFRCDASNNKDIIYLDDIVIMGCTGNGALDEGHQQWRMPNQPLTTIDQQTIAASDEVLISNLKLAPNPTRDLLKISYSLSENSAVEIVVSSFSQQVMLVQNEFYEAGLVELEVNTRTFESGIYFLNIISADKVVSQKFTVVR